MAFFRLPNCCLLMAISSENSSMKLLLFLVALKRMLNFNAPLTKASHAEPNWKVCLLIQSYFLCILVILQILTTGIKYLKYFKSFIAVIKVHPLKIGSNYNSVIYWRIGIFVC